MRTYHHHGTVPYVWIPVVLAVTLLAVSLACNALASESPVGIIDQVLGTVYLQHAWEETPSIAHADDNVFPKDRIRTDVNAKAHIIFSASVAIRKWRAVRWGVPIVMKRRKHSRGQSFHPPLTSAYARGAHAVDLGGII